MPTNLPHNPNPGSLLEGIDVPAPGHQPHAQPRAPRPFLPPILKDNRVNRWVARHKRIALSVLAVLIVGGGLLLWDRYRLHPTPDYATADMEDLLDYTFITDDFNKLPIDERLDLIRDLIRRFSTMEGSDSVLMAQWAAMIGGDLREKMMRNASLVAIDMWDSAAAKYASVPADDRGKFLDDTVVDFLRTMDSMNPNGPRDVTNEQLLGEAREQAGRDKDAIRSGEMSSGELGRMADFMRNGMGKFAAPQTQTRAAQMMRDMTRHLRGQDVATGKPLPPGGK
jgi:hypothetical protein